MLDKIVDDTPIMQNIVLWSKTKPGTKFTGVLHGFVEGKFGNNVKLGNHILAGTKQLLTSVQQILELGVTDELTIEYKGKKDGPAGQYMFSFSRTNKTQKESNNE